MSGRGRLELTWVGKDQRPRLEPRILLEDPAQSYRGAKAGITDNLLIHGDNLLALKALESEYAGKVKCVYIDPPYNTGNDFIQYTDGMEHSQWLSMMRDRLEMLWHLLTDDGSIWITLDDNEHAHCKVMADEIFGRANFVGNIAWQKKVSPANDAVWFSGDHDHILVYAKNRTTWRPNRLQLNERQKANYTNPDNDPRGPWNSTAYTCAKSAEERPNLYYEITNPHTGDGVWPRRERVWAFEKGTHERHAKEDLIYWGKDGTARMPRFKKFPAARGVVPRSVWPYDETGHTQEATLESQAIFGRGAGFSTPKPERLLHRVLLIATKPGDLVLDSFAGSGTTGAVAHKMGRRWIMVEMGEHCRTHIIPRLKKVIDGADPGGVTEAAEWTGGGGFRFLHLAPSLMEKDQWGRWVINQAYRPEMVAEAVCRLEGFTYAPSDSIWWQHGRVGDRSFLYVTTESMTHDQLVALSAEVGPERSLVVCCAAYEAGEDEFPNLQFRKLPNAVLSRCEWGRDDYSVPLAEAPPETATEEEPAPEPAPVKRGRGRPKGRSTDPAQGGLFGAKDDGGEP